MDGQITPFEKARLADWRTAVLAVLSYTSVARFGDFLGVSRGQVHFEGDMLVIHFGLSKMKRLAGNRATRNQEIELQPKTGNTATKSGIRATS